MLSHLPLVPHICVSELGKHWFRQWLVASSAPSHYLNQCWLIVNWTLRNTPQKNSNQNTKVFIHENAFECVGCEMAAILSRGRWINSDYLGIHCLAQAIFKLLAMENCEKPKIRIFLDSASIRHRFTLFTSECLFYRVINHNDLVTDSLLFNKGVKSEYG